MLKDRLNISDTVWADCSRQRSVTGESLISILISRGISDEETILKILSEDLEIPYLRLKSEDIDPDLAKRVPARLVTHYDFMPIQEENGILTAAVHDPVDVTALDEIGLYLHCKVKPVLSSRKDINEAVKKFYGLGAETLEEMAQQQKAAPENQGFELLRPLKSENIKDEAIDPSVIKFINQVLSDAIKQRATDIHFESSCN